MRTAVCKKCGAKHLKWAESSLGMLYLAEFDSGAEHYLTCPGVKDAPKAEGKAPEGPEDDGEAAPEPKAAEADEREPEGEGAEGDEAESGEAEGEGDSAESDEAEGEADEPKADNEAESGEAEGEGEKADDSEEYDSEAEREDEAEADSGAKADEPDEAAEAEGEAEPEPKADEAPKAPEPEHHDHRLQPVLNRWIRIGLNVMTVGPAGGGKTTAARNAADTNGLRYFEQSMGPQTSQWDLVGYNGPNGEFHPGFLYEPFKFGGLAMLDEVDAGNPGILVVLNSMMANGHYTFPNGEEVARHSDFRIMAGANTYGRGADRVYVGRNQLDGATLDRFAVLDWDYDEAVEAEWAGADATAASWTAFVQRIRKVAFDLKMRFIVSPRASIYGARMLRAGFDRAEVEEAVLWKGLAADERAKFAHVAR